MLDKNADNIQVMVRCRALNDREIREGAKSCLLVSEDYPNQIILDQKPDPKTYNFDYVGGENVSQQEIFQVAGKPITQATLDGYNCCIFAYGQTGAGKTFTMQGKGLEKDAQDPQLRGLQPRVFDYLFGLTSQERKECSDVEYLIRCSYLEIYNEQIMDLLSSTCNNLLVREDLKKGVYIEGLTEENTKNSDETVDLLRKGARNRHVGATQMNFESSRSHSVFTMTIESKKIREGMINVKASKLHFVDLAGSERQKKTGAEGKQFLEATNINKSLTTLGLVINSLVEDSLGGNSRTVMIAAVSCASTSFQETLSTLKFAQRAKMIKNKASINEESSGSMESLRKEVKRLKEELQNARQTIDKMEEERVKGGAIEQESLANSNIQQQQIGGGGDSMLLLSTSRLSASGNKKHSPGYGHLQAGGNAAGFLPAVLERELSELNQRATEVERVFRNSLERFGDVEEHLQTELNKQVYYLNLYQAAARHYDERELHYRLIIYLQQCRNERFMALHRAELLTSSENFAADEYRELQAQCRELVEVLRTSELVLQVVHENVELKQMLDQSEGLAALRANNGNNELANSSNSTLCVAQSVMEHAQQIKEVRTRLNESLEDRKQLREKFDRANLLRLPTPEKVKMFDESFALLKAEYAEREEKLNFEICSLKQRELAQDRTIEQEKRRVRETQQEIHTLREKQHKEIQIYEKRISELVEGFEHFEAQKHEETVNAHQTQVQVLRSELEAKHQQTVASLEEEVRTAQIQQVRLQEEREEIEQQLRARLATEAQQAEAQLHKLRVSVEQFTADLSHAKKENVLLAAQLSENEQVFARRFQELEQRVIRAEYELEQEREKSTGVESERAKVQEELDTMMTTMAYLNEQAKEYAKVAQESEKVIGNLQRERVELEERLKTRAPGRDESEALRLFQEQNHELRTQLEFESNQNISLRSALNQKMNLISEVQQSEEHYRSAYLDIRNQLQSAVLKNKDLQQALSQKEMEHYELQREMKGANENIIFLQERVVAFKDEAKLKHNKALKEEEANKITNKKLLALQETLARKMEELQRATARKSDIENKMASQSKELDELRQQSKRQNTSNDKALQDVLKNYGLQKKELNDVQAILNGKIEENLALTANIRILQNVLEKQSQQEVEVQQKNAESVERNEREKSALKHRIDKLIDSVQYLEGRIIQQINAGVQDQQQQNADSQAQQKLAAAQKDIAQFQQQIQEKDKLIQKLQQKESQLEEATRAIQQQFKQYSQQLERIPNAEQETKRIKEEYEQQLSTAKKELENVRRKQNVSQQGEVELQRLKESNERLKQDSIQNQQEIASLQRKLLASCQQQTTAPCSNDSAMSYEENSSNNNNNGRSDTVYQQQQLQNEAQNLIVQSVQSVASFLWKEMQGISRALLRGLPKISNPNDFSENFSFLSPGVRKLIESYKEKEESFQNLMKEYEQKDIYASKLEKEKSALCKKLGLAGISVNGLLTPKASVVQQAGGYYSTTKASTSFKVPQAQLPDSFRFVDRTNTAPPVQLPNSSQNNNQNNNQNSTQASQISAQQSQQSATHNNSYQQHTNAQQYNQSNDQQGNSQQTINQSNHRDSYLFMQPPQQQPPPPQQQQYQGGNQQQQFQTPGTGQHQNFNNNNNNKRKAKGPPPYFNSAME